MMSINMQKIVTLGLGGLIFLFFAAAPVLLPLVTNPFWVSIAAEILIWSLLAASVNLLLGYTGLLSFGQALYFGVGMYGVAIGVSKFGLGFWPAFGLGIFAGTTMAAITGTLAVRLTWHYFAIITVVFSLIFYFIALTLKSLTGGDDGLAFSLPPMMTWGDWQIGLTDPNVQYYFVFFVVAACFLLMGVVLRSPFGRALVAIRENADRAELVGFNVYLLRLTSFIFAGFLAGTAGALFALFGRYASASYMFYHVSGEAVVWAIVGGAGTLLGPIIGTGLLILIREELSLYWDHYLLLVGAIVILTVRFAPRGIAGFVIDLVAKLPAEHRRKSENRPKKREAAE